MTTIPGYSSNQIFIDNKPLSSIGLPENKIEEFIAKLPKLGITPDYNNRINVPQKLLEQTLTPQKNLSRRDDGSILEIHIV